MTKLLATFLFILWCYLALQVATGADMTPLVAVTVMIVLVETRTA